MESSHPALEEARRAGIDLDLLDENLALTCEQRLSRHAEAVEKVRAYENQRGRKFPARAIIRRVRSGIEVMFKVKNGDVLQRIG